MSEDKISQKTQEKGKIALIVGAGPAGLTAAYSLLKAGVKPIILESSPQVGGISKTVRGEKWSFDIGPHRFFTKAPAVSALWEEILPSSSGQMLIKKRSTRIYHLGRLFDYPIRLTFSTLAKLGFGRSLKIFFSYLRASLFPQKAGDDLESFFCRRFGRELYLTFFKDYTEKVWGKSCRELSSAWGAQRVRALSLARVLKEAAAGILKISPKKIETSLIKQFRYPRLGAGQLYEAMAEEIIKNGGEIILDKKVVRWQVLDNSLVGLIAIDQKTGETKEYSADYYLSSQPLRDLIAGMPTAPENIKKIAAGLEYRSLIIVALSYNRLAGNDKQRLSDENWVYIQEKGKKMGRLSIINNFSEDLIKEKGQYLLTTEFFCQENDDQWNAKNKDLISLAQDELESLGIAKKEDFSDASVWRQADAYPAYFGTYGQLGELRSYLDGFPSLFPIGRNGQHRYNNMDHSIMTALAAAESIESGSLDKTAVWNVNTGDEYQEE